MHEVYLTKDQYKHALDVGFQRSVAHRDDKGIRGGSQFRTGRKLPDITGDQLGAVAECAVGIFYNTKWNDHAWDLSTHATRKTAPDVEPNFEVRRINFIDGQLSLRADDEPSKTAILAYVDWENSQRVVLVGGISIDYVFKNAKPASYAMPGDNYLYFEKDNTYMVMQAGLQDVLEFSPVNALEKVN